MILPVVVVQKIQLLKVKMDEIGSTLLRVIL